MAYLFAGLVLASIVSGIYFLIRLALDLVNKADYGTHLKRFGISMGVFIAAFVGVAVTMPPQNVNPKETAQPPDKVISSNKKDSSQKSQTNTESDNVSNTANSPVNVQVWKQKVEKYNQKVLADWEEIFPENSIAMLNGVPVEQKNAHQKLKELEKHLIDDEMLYYNLHIPDDIDDTVVTKMQAIREDLMKSVRCRREASEKIRLYYDGTGASESKALIQQSEKLLNSANEQMKHL